MKEFDDVNFEAILQEVSKKLPSEQKFVIAIDGFDGTGKSNLAYKLGAAFLASVINLDDFVFHDKGMYVGAINFEMLSSRISLLKQRKLIVEGCCLLDVLKITGTKHDVLIYSKEISEGSRIWHDGERFVYPEFYEGKSLDLKGLEQEIYEYHRKNRPWEKADIIYNLINQHKK